MRLLFNLLVCLSVATPALPGAWMRETGRSFTSHSFTLNRLRDHTSGTYIEYGLRDDLTIGADLSFASSHLGLQSGAVTLFLRRPLGRTDGTHKWAYEIGAGTAWVQDLMLPHVKVGLSWGRGYQLGDRYGWLAVDGATFIDVNSGRSAVKLDGTVGFNFSDTIAAMGQVYFSRIEGQSHTTLAPSFLYKPKNRNYRFQIGAESPIDDFGNTSIKLGLWREF